MPTILCYVSEETQARLLRAANELGRKADELAECAIEEAALNYERKSPTPVRAVV